MEIERFQALADAFGADMRRWPQAERGAAGELMARAPARAREILDAADVLDAALASSAAIAPSQALRQAVLASAPKPRAGLLGGGRGLGFWLSGAGLAAAGMAGVIVGFTGLEAAVADARVEAYLDAALPEDLGAELPWLLPTLGSGPDPGRQA